MEIFRITKVRWSTDLVASGHPARWNSSGIKVIYAAATRSLACLENLVHRGELGQEDLYRTMVIYIPDALPIHPIHVSELPQGWASTDEILLSKCRQIGDQWARSLSTPILKVPSAIIKNEFNYICNPAHPDFVEIKLINVEQFFFDSRL